MFKKLLILVIFASAVILRLVNLGYSDYQGDEIKALYNPTEVNSIQFFLDQRKGPVQFMITAALKDASNNYHNRFLVRLPFALAGVGSIVVFYYLVKRYFGDLVALYATIFFFHQWLFCGFFQNCPVSIDRDFIWAFGCLPNEQIRIKQ